jgi:hypothetical protein
MSELGNLIEKHFADAFVAGYTEFSLYHTLKYKANLSHLILQGHHNKITAVCATPHEADRAADILRSNLFIHDVDVHGSEVNFKIPFDDKLTDCGSDESTTLEGNQMSVIGRSLREDTKVKSKGNQMSLCGKLLRQYEADDDKKKDDDDELAKKINNKEWQSGDPHNEADDDDKTEVDTDGSGKKDDDNKKEEGVVGNLANKLLNMVLGPEEITDPRADVEAALNSAEKPGMKKSGDDRVIH